jgi:hypothetical protein
MVCKPLRALVFILISYIPNNGVNGQEICCKLRNDHWNYFESSRISTTDLLND